MHARVALWRPGHGVDAIYEAAMRGDYELLERLYAMGAPESPGTLEDLMDKWFDSLSSYEHWIGVTANLERCLKIVLQCKQRHA